MAVLFLIYRAFLYPKSIRPEAWSDLSQALPEAWQGLTAYVAMYGLPANMFYSCSLFWGLQIDPRSWRHFWTPPWRKCSTRPTRQYNSLGEQEADLENDW